MKVGQNEKSKYRSMSELGIFSRSGNMLQTLKLMKEGLTEAGLINKVYLMCQPVAYHTPDAGKQGFIGIEIKSVSLTNQKIRP